VSSRSPKNLTLIQIASFAYFKSGGLFVRSPSSTLEDRVVERVRSHLAANPLRGRRVPQPAPVDDDDVDPQEEAIRRNLGADRLSTATTRPPRRASSSLVRPSRGTDRRPTRGRTKPLPDAWAMHWFDPEERDAWLRSGVDEPRDAEAYLDAGITPETRRMWGTLPARAITTARELGLGPEDMDTTIGESPSIGLMLETGSTKSEILELYVRWKAAG